MSDSSDGLAGGLPTLDELQRWYIRYVLKRTGGRRESAARILGIDTRALHRKERQYGVVVRAPVEDLRNSTDEGPMESEYFKR